MNEILVEEAEDIVVYKCERCEDTGITTKTEWSGEDNSYEVEMRCPDCNNND